MSQGMDYGAYLAAPRAAITSIPDNLGKIVTAAATFTVIDYLVDMVRHEAPTVKGSVTSGAGFTLMFWIGLRLLS
jgi:predicted acyltransferase